MFGLAGRVDETKAGDNGVMYIFGRVFLFPGCAVHKMWLVNQLFGRIGMGKSKGSGLWIGVETHL
jgi:hypothetical protein